MERAAHFKKNKSEHISLWKWQTIPCFCVFVCFLLNLLGWHWLTRPYRFQVYNSIILTCIQHYVLSPKVKSLSSTIYPPPPPPIPLSLWQISYCSQCLFFVVVFVRVFFVRVFLLIPSAFSPSPQLPSFLTAVSLLSVSMSLFLFC